MDKLPLDARLLSNAVIELNIARHIISLYPGNHALVDKAVDRAFEILLQLFELRKQITLAVAKDTLIIDRHYLDRKNPVYRDFALSLSKMYIACVTFIKGITKEEVYSLHRFLTRDPDGLSAVNLTEVLKEYNLPHVLVEPLDYQKFSFQEGKTEKEGGDKFLLERYVKGLIDGTLLDGDGAEVLESIPPEILAGLLNQSREEIREDKTYDRIITSYLRSASGPAFTSKELGRLLVFIHSLKPELKRQFLSSSVKGFRYDLSTMRSALEGVSADQIFELLESINEHCVTLPDSLRNLLAKFASKGPELLHGVSGNMKNLADDIILAPEIMNLLEEGEGGNVNTKEYKKEITRLTEADFGAAFARGLPKLSPEWDVDFIRYSYSQTLLELVSFPAPDLLQPDDSLYYAGLLCRQAEQMADSGQYGQIFDLLRQLEGNVKRNIHPEIARQAIEHCHDKDFISRLTSTFHTHGRAGRGGATMLCDYYGETIVSPLLDLLGVDESASVRKFVVGVLVRLREKVHRECLRRLADRRWYMRRNILHVLGEIGDGDMLRKAKPFCRDEDPRVRAEAARCMLMVEDDLGIATLKEMMRSPRNEVADLAIAQAGAAKVSELVPDLLKRLKGTAVRGSDYRRRISIVRALRNIGDSRAEGALREIIQMHSVLYRKDLEKLKAEAGKALGHLAAEE